MQRRNTLSLVIVLAMSLTAAAAEPSASTPSQSPRFRAALDQALQETEADARLHALWDVGSSLTSADFPAALEVIDELKELREQMVFQEAALVRWSEVAPQDAFAHTAALPETQAKVNTLREVVTNFASKEPAQAAAAASGMSLGASRNDAIEAIANIWAQKDIDGALAWAQKLPDDFAKESALNAIRYVWVHSDPEDAAKHVEQLPESQTRNNLISNVAYEWAARDVPAAIQWANKLPDGPDKNEALVKIAESWANQDPKSATAFAVGLPQGDTRLAAVALAASRWARQDPLTALQWSMQNEDADVRVRGAAAALEVWAPVDPVAAGRWLAELPMGPQRDQLIFAYVEAAVMWAPDVVADRALLIAEPKARARAVEQCLSRWREVGAAGADRWAHDTAYAAATAAPSSQDLPGSSQRQSGEGEWQNLMVAAVKAQKAGELARAESLANDALALARQFSPPDTRVARCYMLLGEIHRWQKNFPAAEASFKEALAQSEKVVGADDPQMVPALDCLANFYFNYQQQYEKVLPLYQRLLRIVERDSSLDKRDVAQRARNLGNIYRYLGKNDEAESYYKSAVAQVEQISATSPDLPQHLLTLSEFYRFQQRYAEAEPLAKRALAICGPEKNSLGAAVSHDELAAVYLAWGKPAEAEPHYARTLMIVEHIVGPEHSDLAPRLAGLAESQRDQGKFAEAEANYLRAIAVVEKGLGRNAPELIAILQSYAKLLDATNRSDEAKSQRLRAAAIEQSSAESTNSVVGGRQ